MEVPAAAVSSAPRPTPRRPGWLTFFAIVAITIGVLRAWEMASLVLMPRVLNAQQHWLDGVTSGQADDPIKQLNRKNLRRIDDVYDHFAVTIRVLAVGDVVMALALIAGGIGVLSLRRRARPLVIAGFVLALALAVGTGGQVLRLERALSETARDNLQRSMEAAGRTTSPGLATFTSLGAMAEAMRLLVDKVLLVAVAGLGAAGIIYFTQPHVRQLFDGQAPS
ncbi:MAG: hypothetical protein QOI66_4141 [Myxococcales bacterium]|nr:hypothetical protein [Myxococcales bacterium]